MSYVWEEIPTALNSINFEADFRSALDGWRDNMVDMDSRIDTGPFFNYIWADATARAAQTGMSTGEYGLQQDTNAVYSYSGSAWVFQYYMIPDNPTFTTVTVTSGITGTLSTVAQPNITSVGTLSGLDVSNVNEILITATNTTANDRSIIKLLSGTSHWRIINYGQSHVTSPGAFSITEATTNRLLISAGGNLAIDTDTLYVDAVNDRVGIGTVAPSCALDTAGTIRSTSFSAPTSGIGLEMFYNGSYSQIQSYNRTTPGYTDLALGYGGTQLYLKNDGNVGVGTASPDSYLSGVAGLSIYNATYSGIALAAGASNWLWYTGTDSVLRLLDVQSGGGERLTVDHLGNVGIGTASSQTVLQLGQAGSGTAEATYHGQLLLQHTAGSLSAVSGIEFKHSASASGYGWKITDLNDATDSFVIANRLNSAIWTQRFTVQGTTGNVGIGTSSPEGLLSFSASDSATPKIRFQNSSSVTGDAAVSTYDDTNGTTLCIGSNFYIGVGGTTNRFNTAEESCAIAVNRTGNIEFMTGSTGATATIQAIIDSTGNVGIGRTPTQKLDVYVASGSVQALVESASMSDTNGVNIKVTGSSKDAVIGVYKHSGLTNAAGYLALGRDDDASISYFYTGEADSILRTSTSASNIGTTSGTVVGTPTSDERLKDNIQSISYGLADVLKLKPIEYDMNGVHTLGFGAQTTRPIIPECVYDTKQDSFDDVNNTQLAMDYAQITPALTMAIQELDFNKAERSELELVNDKIRSYEKRIAELEEKVSQLEQAA